ncbi:plasmid mobilization protein [uncultured Alistipes sp.]|uniref:plasmid mobilization protein n=1 Tax=uncultured Alistipes sp. TaxID=538949 RepID=UPI0032097BE9
METPKKTYSKQGGRPKVGIGRIRRYVVSTRLSPERKLRFSALCREAGQPPAEVLRQLIDRGTVTARITREQLDFMAQLKGVARNLNQLTRLANAKVCRELIEKHGLYLAPGKDDVQRERLREPDKTRYEIHDAIKGCLPKCKNWNELEGKLKEQGIGVHYKYCGSTDRRQGVLFSKNGFEFSGSKIDRAFSFTKLDNRFNHIQQQTQHRATLFGNLSAAAGNYRSAFAGLFGGMGGGSTREEPLSVNLEKAGGIPLPPAGSPVGVSAEQLQRKPGESPEEHIARITALLNAAAEAMAIAAMEHRRRLEEQKRRAKIKL